jgi:Ni/Fe-hydrogenase subunit HybB-like protein
MSETAAVTSAQVDAAAQLPLRYPASRGWWVCFGGALVLLGFFVVSVTMLLIYGVGIWGNNIPVSWAFPIINYIWFLGIGHAGTLISAMLLLVNADWRNSLSRFAEAMTLFAVVCAGLYPILHLGRPWLFYWMAPYPNVMALSPQFKSPLSWDFFAVLAYLIVSLLFWYIGAIPDFASLRDASRKRFSQVLYGLLALGWRGSGRHWIRWTQAYRLMAVLAVPMVFGVTAAYSMLLAAGPEPGWASTIFPPYFLAGAVFSGFAVVAMIAAMLQASLPLEALLTEQHFDRIGQLLLATGLMTGYGYVQDVFFALYSDDPHELVTLASRISGQYAWSYWGAIILNFVPLQLLWFRTVRISPLKLAAIGACVVVGMWLERYMLLLSTLRRDYLVSSWHAYTPTFWDWSLFAGMIGLFLTLFLLFVRFVPVVAAFEIKHTLVERERHHA